MNGLKELARQAGFTSGEIEWHDEMLERFAKLVAAKEREKFLRLSTKAKDVDENCDIVLAADIRGDKA